MKRDVERRDRLLKEKRHDVYDERRKWPEQTSCSRCGALYLNGRWTWYEKTTEGNHTICPACRRIIDHYPAGYIQLEGAFIEQHRDEIFNLIHNIEELEKAEHPLERIMDITDASDHTLITTTGIHLARRIGEALAKAYGGEYTFQYADAAELIRVSWQR